MSTQFCFINGATYGIGAEIATAPRAQNNQIAATGRKPSAVTENSSVAKEVARNEQAEMALLPTIEVAFTIGGPLVYEQPSNQLS
jgi:short-subunit dehydrogenase